MKPGRNYCAWCGRWAVPAVGLILERIAHGRTMCTGCGRFQLHCTCEAVRVLAKAA